LITATEPWALAGDNEVLVLRRREDTLEIDYTDTDDQVAGVGHGPG
jgi:hypothetical protein